MKVYGIKNCDSVKKALKYLHVNEIDYDFVDFKEQKPTLQLIQKWADAVGIKKLFNTRSTTYRNLGLKQMNLSDEQKIEWMAKEPLLIKRPVVEKEEVVLVGYSEEEYKRNL
ncbi:MAG: Spx/MgsR family RNA polymerase-binding regulatory protein [Epsilonproteobacteria bacterium]|nr:Spx/MgsR family RNA polymerase-binding regulatory protein [Campylobacterota bacterium]